MGVIHVQPGFDTSKPHNWTGVQSFRGAINLPSGTSDTNSCVIQDYGANGCSFSPPANGLVFSGGQFSFDPSTSLYFSNLPSFHLGIQVQGGDFTMTDHSFIFAAATSYGIKWSSYGNTLLGYYGEGAWTPTFSGLTVVNGTGSATFSGVYERIGNLVKWQALISVTGTCTTSAAAAGATTITNLPFSAANPDTCNVADAAMSQTFAVGYVSGLVAKMPAWAADNNNIVISGQFYI